MNWGMKIAPLLVAIAQCAMAESVSFEEAWHKISESSLAMESSRLQAEALTESQNRISRHWLPRVYLDVKSYQTNDPGASFFGLLEQRSLQTDDFNPNSINHPEASLFTRGALGLDLAFYEGGMRSVEVDASKHAINSQKNMMAQVQIELYSQVGLAYGSIVILGRQREKLQTLSSEISRMMKAYQLGSRSNPIGYSGLLGMKSLANRLRGLINQSNSQSRSFYFGLNELGLRPSSWTPEEIESTAFIDRYFSVDASSENSNSSYKIEAARAGSKASEEMAKMEKARFLPRVGAFAESFAFSGDRTKSTGYNAGLYLQWNLFSPADFGGLREAELKAGAMSKTSEAGDQRERAERVGLTDTIQSLKENITLLEDSDRLLVQQSQMTETLFKNGSINALQIVELLNRRTDLVTQETETRLGLVKAASELVTKKKFDIDQHLRMEAKK